MAQSQGFRRHIGGAVVSMLSLAGVAAAGFSQAASAADPVVFSFATLGDSRTDPAAPDPTTLIGGDNGPELKQDQLWVQNSKAFSRILRTIQTEKPNLLFFNGDMIYGYGRAALPPAWNTATPSLPQVIGSDLVQHYTQYAYWRGMVADLFETGTYVIPVPGNHETQCSASATFDAKVNGASNCDSVKNGGKNAYIENEQAFVTNMGDLIEDLTVNQRFTTVSGLTALNVSGTTGGTAGTAPQVGSNGGITSDQHDLTYSFDIQLPNGGALLHFAVVNTDPSGADGIAPAQWLATDFQAARARGAAKFFVFGHKPAFTYNYNPIGKTPVVAGGLDVNPTARNQFWSVIAQYNAAYFSGHEHTVNAAQYADPTPGSTITNTPWQVIVGSGGSPFDDKMAACGQSTCPEPAQAAASDRYYAWALIQVHQSGAVSMTVYGFSDRFGPIQAIKTVASLQ